ncbi:MAG: glycosyltransferase family 39 protein [Deltaproteobacteria bacterium]|nr:glycosyltransferase family 39 protein [Deltaproteobacteria bacterium]
MREILGLAWLALAAVAVTVAVARVRRDADAPLRSAVLEASIVLGVLTVVGVEVASAAARLAAVPLAAFWAGVALIATIVAARAPGEAALPTAPRRPAAAARDYAATTQRRVLLALVTAFAALTAVTAVAAPPNNWDAMTYHMSRVAHWLANTSLRHYPTARTQQLFMPPLNAYAIATLQALAASDAWANLVQWTAYVGSAAIASLGVRRLHGGPTAELAAALAFLTLPMAIAQAATAQADLLTAYWVLALLALIVGPATRRLPLWAGATVGLGLLTKPSFALYAAPFVLALLARHVRGRGTGSPLRSAFAAAIALVAIPLALQAPHALRNRATFGTPWGGGHEVARMQNEIPGPRSWLSNLARATAVHVPVPGYAEAVIDVHRWLGIDPDDPRTTHLHDLSFTQVAAQWFRPLIPSENSVGNPTHFLTALVLLLAVMVRPGGWSPRAATALAIAVLGVAGWALFSLPFKWQAWTARFDLPLFAALCIPFGLAMGRATTRAASLVMASWVIGALPSLTLAVHRPLIGMDVVARAPAAQAAIAALGGERAQEAVERHAARAQSVLGAANDDVLFRSNRDAAGAYRAAVEAVRASGCMNVGLELDRDDWEYPFWRMLGESAGASAYRIQSVGVTNETTRLAPEGPEPCVVISAVEASTFRGRDGWEATRLGAGRLFTLYRKRGAS